MGKINTVIVLNKPEQAICRTLATWRYRSNRAKAVINSRMGDQSDDQTDLEGVAAEFAFCKLFNLYPASTLEIQPRSAQRGEDTGGDATLVSKVVDVKATTYPNGKLLAVPWKGEVRVDCFALMTGTFPEYTFRGFMTADELLRPQRRGDLGHGITYIAYQSELVEFEDLDNQTELLKKREMEDR